MTIPVTPETYRGLRAAYIDAVNNGADQDSIMTWGSVQLVVGYAYYALQYMQSVLNITEELPQ